MVAERVVRALCAAAHVGASGRVVFCDQGGAWSRFFEGALVKLADGELSAERKRAPFGPEETGLIDEVIAAMRTGNFPPKTPVASTPTRSATPAKKKPPQREAAKKTPAKKKATSKAATKKPATKKAPGKKVVKSRR
jgi:hypothetical protein